MTSTSAHEQNEMAPWPAPPERFDLEGSALDVWRARLGREASEIRQLAQGLSEEEIARAERFRFETDRRRYVVARGLLRVLLSRYTGKTPKDLLLTYGRYGKPELEEGGTQRGLHFNVSHSHDLALYAFSREAGVGVDIELVAEEHVDEQAAEQVLSPCEMAVLRTTPEEEKSAVFYKLWTRKEAYGKAIGKGLAPSLKELTLSLAPRQSVVVLSPGGRGEEHVLVQEIEIGPCYAAAVAVGGSGGAIRCWHWPDRGVVYS